MQKPALILVSGLPAVGKTTIADKIGDHFSILVVSADGLKEVVWGELGYEFDFEFSDKIGKTAFELAFHCIESSLSKGKSVIVEAHFSPEKNKERINNLKKKYNANLVQIYCDCETWVLQNRFLERMKSENYHKCHHHTIQLYGEERILRSLGVKNKRLDIDGETIEIDTTDFDAIDYDVIFRLIEERD